MLIGCIAYATANVAVLAKTLVPSEVLDAALLDAAKRAYDHINIHLTFGNRDDIKRKWIAINLQDGSSDGVLYDSGDDAAKHQFHEQTCWYVSFLGINPGGMSVYDCAKMLTFWRQAYDAGMRFVDPDGRVRAPLMTSGQHDYRESVFKSDILRKIDSIGRIG